MDILYIIVVALMLVTSVALFFGIRVVAANVCRKKAKLLNINSNRWEFLAFFIPITSIIAIYNVDSISRLYGTIKKWGVIIQIAVAIELVLIGVYVFKLYKAETFTTYPDNDNSLYKIRTERRSQEIKSINTSFLIGTCMLGVVVYLIKSSKK